MEFFLSRGKHVLVEKPLILDPEAAAHLSRVSQASRAIWYTSYNFRFEPNVLALKRHLEGGTIGRLYRVRMFYGNGTAGNIAGTWRDSRLGILEDMASHLIDLTGFVFGRFGSEFRVWERRGYELKGFDHCLLATSDRSVTIECSFLSWRNRWRIEALGEDGALEMNGLTKWGKSELLILRRRRPSGVPDESREVARGPDPTWAADIRHFEAMAATGVTSCENDLWLSRAVHAAAAGGLEGGS
jgi:predicted dehydrogenase